jgi:hypothetical protein
MIGRFGEPIPEEVHKAQREPGQKQDRKLFEDTGNAFYVLWALARYRADEELPLWVRQWLLEFAREVLPAYLYRSATTARPATATRRATIDRPEHIPTLGEVREKVLRAFSLTQGKDAVAEVQRCITDDVLAVMRKSPGRGVTRPWTGKYSAKELGEHMGVKPEQIRYRTNRARKRCPE